MLRYDVRFVLHLCRFFHKMENIVGIVDTLLGLSRITLITLLNNNNGNIIRQEMRNMHYQYNNVMYQLEELSNTVNTLQQNIDNLLIPTSPSTQPPSLLNICSPHLSLSLPTTIFPILTNLPHPSKFLFSFTHFAVTVPLK